MTDYPRWVAPLPLRPLLQADFATSLSQPLQDGISVDLSGPAPDATDFPNSVAFLATL